MSATGGLIAFLAMVVAACALLLAGATALRIVVRASPNASIADVAAALAEVIRAVLRRKEP